MRSNTTKRILDETPKEVKQHITEWVKYVINQKKRTKLLNILKEISTQQHSYGAVMLFFNFEEMGELHSQIEEEDIYLDEEDKSFGLEDEPHCTLLYGLHEGVTLKQVEQVLDEYTFYTVKAYNISLFENDKYDVLKFDIEGDNLHEVNKDLKQFPYTTDYPNYHPHMTIGYLKKGKGKKYVKKFKEKYKEIWSAPQYCVYSQPNGEKNKISIKID